MRKNKIFFSVTGNCFKFLFILVKEPDYFLNFGAGNENVFIVSERDFCY